MLKTSKFVAELGHSDLFTIYVDPQNVTTILAINYFQMIYFAPMVLKFRMQHNKTAWLQNDKIEHGLEIKLAAVSKNNEPY